MAKTTTSIQYPSSHLYVVRSRTRTRYAQNCYTLYIVHTILRYQTRKIANSKFLSTESEIWNGMECTFQYNIIQNENEISTFYLNLNEQKYQNARYKICNFGLFSGFCWSVIISCQQQFLPSSAFSSSLPLPLPRSV